MIKTVLFDLDGTLLPQDAEVFTKGYFKALSAWLAPYGYKPDELVNGVLRGLDAMVVNDGTASNADVFWREISRVIGDKVYGDIPKFDAFYAGDGFGELKKLCSPNKYVPELINYIKTLGATLVVATNPVFPMIAQKRRIDWSGAGVENFALVTAYEDSHFCKPNTAYYKEILDKLGGSAAETLMIGNDMTEDMCARDIGMNVFLLTNCLINRRGRNVNDYPHGGFDELNIYVGKLFDA